MASILMNALNANKELWKRARADIDDIAHKVKSALDHYDDCGKNEWEIWLSVVGAVVAVAAVPVTGGASAIALGAVASAVDVASTFAGRIEDPPKNDYSAESVEGVIAKAKQGIEDLKTEVARAEQKIVDAMTSSSGVVAGHASDFLAPRPTLAGAPGNPDVGQPDDSRMDLLTSALEEMTATASTPDGRASATISGRTHVRMSLAPGYYEWASVGDLVRQLTRLAKLLFVARMRAYYEARSRDFEQLFTREPAPTTPLGEAYVRARSEVVVEGEAAGGAVRIGAVGMDSWAVHLDRDVRQRMDEAAFCDAVSRAATQLVELQLAAVRAPKREVYAGP